MPARLEFLERSHGTLKAEEVCWNLHDGQRDARQELEIFRERSNQARPDWALQPVDPGNAPARALTPHEVYVDGYQIKPPK